MNEALEGSSSPEVNLGSVDTAQVSTPVETSVESGAEKRDEASSPQESRYLSQEDFDKKFSERLERERRKLRKEFEAQYRPSIDQNAQVNAQSGQPDLQAVLSQVPEDTKKVVAMIAQQSFQQQKLYEERKAMLDDFMRSRAEEESKDPDFADFSDSMEKRCSEAMLVAAVRLKDPTILYRIHKESPDEFNRILRMSPDEQALKIAEFKGRYQAPPPKVISSAPPPVDAPKSTGSTYQKTEQEMSVRDRLTMRRQTFRQRMNTR